MRLGNLIKVRTGKLDANASSENGKYPFFTCSKETLKVNDYAFDCECVLLAGNGELNAKYYNGKFNAYQRTYVIESIDKEKLSVKYLYYYFIWYLEFLRHQSIGGVIKYIKLGNITEANINIPSIEKQNEIINIFDNLSDFVKSKKAELDNLNELTKSRFIEMFGDPLDNVKYIKKPLKNTCKVITGNTPRRENKEYYGNDIEWIKTDNIVSDQLYPTEAAEYLSYAGLEVGRCVDANAILMACIAGSISSIGRVCIANRKVSFNQQINAIVPIQYNSIFLYVLLTLCKHYLVCDINMAIKGILSKSKLETKEFIVPPIELQNEFAEFVKLIDKSKFVCHSKYFL